MDICRATGAYIRFLLAQALHIDVSLVELVAIIPLIVLIVRLPLSIQGFGVQEGLYVALFSLVPNVGKLTQLG